MSLDLRQYTKRPVTITAVKLTQENLSELAQWCRGQAGKRSDGTPILKIPTLEGVMVAQIGDYIIQGVQGEVYPCKPNIFHQTYTEAHQ